MTYREDPSHGSIPQHALVSGQPLGGEALVAPAPSIPHATIPAPSLVTPATQDVLRGGMDASTFLNALRRRWLLALCLGLVVGTLSAIGMWALFPQSSSAKALFQVSAEQETVLRNDQPNMQGFENLKKTQLALLKSNFVLSAAIRNPKVGGLSALAGEKDQVDWLQRNLSVEFPQNGELLEITLAGDELPDELKILVNAVSEAYEKEVLGQLAQRRAANRDLLRRSLDDVNKDLRSKLTEYLAIAQESDRPQGSERDTKSELLLREIDVAKRKKDDLTTALYALQSDFMIMKSELEDPAVLEAQVEEAIEQDQNVMMSRYQIGQLEMERAATAGQRGGQRAAATLNAKIEAATRQLNEYLAGAKVKMLRELKSKPNIALQQLKNRYRTNIMSIQQQLAVASKTLDDKIQELELRLEKSGDLEARKMELDQLQELVNDMSKKLETLDIEANAAPQIRRVQDAVIYEKINASEHYTLIALGGLAGFGLTCFGIGFLEFRNRRLNGPHEVDEGLGIRVVGTLPGLSARTALDPNHPIVAQLTESIDGVRTILMHDTSSKRRQVVLVTSAATMEGRTTVASQLAASLARAGRRTLLIDGDLRRPAMHNLFDVPLEDGLCEILRAEVEVTDVIRPTHAEGLWLLTAGYCDIDAIHALATEQMQPVFDKLRAEYDFIIIDGAPVLGMSDALIFGQYSDGAILSVRRDESQMPKIHQAAELLRGVGIRIIGAVVNGVQAKADDRIVQMRLMAPKAERELQPVG